MGSEMLDSLIFAAVMATGPKDLPDSQYQGSHNPGTSRFEEVRKCIIWRESRGNPKADGEYGSGLYQFVSPTWDHYAAKAPIYVQDEIFAVTLNPFPKRPGFEGLHHWSAIHAASHGFNVRDCG